MGFCASLLLNALRIKLKENDLTYNELSLKVNVPISTLKRHFHSNSIGIDKLMEYATVLNTNIEELSQIARDIHNREEGTRTEVLDEVFFNHPYLYDFFYEIHVKGRAVDDVAQENNLTEQSVYIYLRALEIMGLLELRSDGVPSFLTPPYYTFFEGSKLDKLFTEKLRLEVLTQDCRPEVGMSRVCLTQEQIEQISEMVYEKVQHFHFQNKESKESEFIRKNILLNITEGNYIHLSDGIINIESTFLKELYETVNYDETN
ncbi:XRE family transcriptional regulator [Aliivibrio sp. S3MY1]|uniref:XRE family transcriptional regulator n=1 Tax=unclassified Aliivibrio TaxID=2645654 RepID=UPI002379A180|nr:MULTISPECIES: XRE family transcriptional regulator [unclassified Aliivibrio]MDD9197359.1 XRE family transcriptional regulator [Aliivibrio sp. S3MY1]MDD9197876.1 XRE family transcriptional regulator [Aliivibrio sp. S2MY1]